MNARDEAIAEVVEAITNPGPRPDVHRETMRRHRQEWPTLWRALDRLVAEYEPFKEETEFLRGALEGREE